jgi:hypothetical protein
MELGVGLPTNLRGTNKDLALEWSRRAEEAGFASLCMGERLSYAGYDWLLALTAAASVTPHRHRRQADAQSRRLLGRSPELRRRARHAAR